MNNEENIYDSSSSDSQNLNNNNDVNSTVDSSVSNVAPESTEGVSEDTSLPKEEDTSSEVTTPEPVSAPEPVSTPEEVPAQEVAPESTPEPTPEPVPQPEVVPMPDANQINMNAAPINNNGMPGAIAQPVNQKNNKTGLIIGIVVAVVVGIIVFVMVSGKSSSNVKGDWECTGTNGSVKINFTDKKVTMDMTQSGMTVTLTGDYSKFSSNVKPAAKKDGFKYVQYQIKNAKANAAGTEVALDSGNYGFIFGLDKDGKKAHYIDSVSATALQYDCTKK